MTGIQVSGMIYFIAAMVVGFGALGLSIYKCVNLTKDRRQTIDYKPYLKFVISSLAVFTALFPLGLLSVYIWNSYHATWQNYLQVIFGGLLFESSLGIGINSFIVHY